MGTELNSFDYACVSAEVELELCARETRIIEDTYLLVHIYVLVARDRKSWSVYGNVDKGEENQCDDGWHALCHSIPRHSSEVKKCEHGPYGDTFTFIVLAAAPSKFGEEVLLVVREKPRCYQSVENRGDRDEINGAQQCHSPSRLVHPMRQDSQKNLEAKWRDQKMKTFQHFDSKQRVGSNL